ncbi:MAG: beta-ketoacyl-[acyl-carrier-protein] synthase family protein [Bryobacter sp.]
MNPIASPSASGSRRVVVTGLGCVSTFGKGVAPFWQALSQGQHGIRPLPAPKEGDLKITTGAWWADYDPAAHLGHNLILLADRGSQFAILAAREALADAGLEKPPTNSAIVTGCCVGGKHAEDASYWDVYAEKKPRVHPLTIPRVMANSGASLIAMELGITGPTFTTSTACSSANHALGQAFWMLRSGMVPMAIAGGHESPFVFGLLKAWEAMRVVSPDLPRPFSAGRKGMSLGEGAGMLLLEDRDHALARGARIYAEIAGFGMSADAHHITQPLPEGAALAMQGAMEDAALAPAAIGYINAHGTGTLANDPVETKAIRLALGDSARLVSVSSTKSMHGHALGAAGALEAIATVLALHHGLLPPTANYENPDPECDLDVIPHAPRVASPAAALSNSFAFGGLNAVLAFRR